MQSLETQVASPAPRIKSILGKWDNLLSDSFLGLLALITLFLAFTPSIFDLSPKVESSLTIIENLILGLFLAEYMLSLYLSSNRIKFAFSFWRILDALIITVGLLSLMPFIGDQFRHALSLRLLRFLRIALFSVKIRNVITIDHTNAVAKDANFGEVTSYSLTQSDVVPMSWETIKTCLKNKEEDWLLSSNININHLLEVANLLNVSSTHLSRLFFESQFPRIESMEKYTTLFLWLPSIVQHSKGDIPTIKRDAMLLVGSAHNILVLCRNNVPIAEEVMKQSAEYEDAASRLPLMTWAFLKVVSLRYVEIIDHLEKALFKIDAQQKSLSDAVFLDTTFKLRSEITRMRSNTKHLAQAVRQLSDKPISIKGFDTPPRSIFAVLFDDINSLYDGADDLLNNLSALVELRLNISSFQMNKVMRLLAILTTLTLIPAITGGMLGMNLLDNPWPLTLAEVSYCVAAGISISLYIFAVKGWFR